jgi:hypothetical protein
MDDGRIRLSDAERDAAAADLGEHYAQGRLSADEHDERLGAVWAAKTRAEIGPILRDLPSAYAGVAAPARQAEPPRGPAYWSSGPRVWNTARRLPTPLFVVLALVVALTVLTHLPFILFGLLVWVFVAGRHRGWHGGWHGGWQGARRRHW